MTPGKTTPGKTDPANGAGPALDHVEAWIFDLDNTLYPASCNLFAQIDQRMGEFISRLLGVGREQARAVQKHYFRTYGTTLNGLMAEHGLDPDSFLAYVHEIDLSPVPPSPVLVSALARLEGPKYVFTNASAAHAEGVMDRLGVSHLFEAVFDIAAGGYRPKPEPATYDKLLARHAIDPQVAVLADDIPRNLEPAAILGMTTVWVKTRSEYAQIGAIGDHIHHVAEDLAGWLEGVVGARARLRLERG